MLVKPDAFTPPDLFAKHSSLTPLTCQPGYFHDMLHVGVVKENLDLILQLRPTIGLCVYSVRGNSATIGKRKKKKARRFQRESLTES